jgi:serine/threonine-protein kinase
MPALASRLRVIARVCEAVAFAHANAVIHRDLTPSNIMVGSFGEVLTLDWGLAAMVHPQERAPAGVQGTAGYAAPELSSNGTALTPAVDIFALGGVLQFAVTGRHPAAAGDESGHWSRAQAPLRAIADKARRPKASDRYASVDAFAEDLLRYLDHERVMAYREPWFATLARWLTRYQWVAALIAAYLLMRVLLIWWSGHDGS